MSLNKQEKVATRKVATSLLNANAVSKRYGGVQALDNASIELQPGEIRAICGENGAGKSTLVKILTGIVMPDNGTIEMHGKKLHLHNPRDAQEIGINLVSQELSVCPDLSVLDNIWLGTIDVPFFHKRWHMKTKAIEVLNNLGAGYIGINTLVSSLSTGERQIVEIARMLTRDTQVLILDEPTATLSDSEIRLIFNALKAVKAEGRSILYITHRLSEVFEICDTVTVMRNGKVVESCAVSELDRKSLIELMLGRTLGEMFPEHHVATGDTALSISNLSIPNILEDVSLSVPAGQIVCLTGQVGSGIESIVRSICGLVDDATGQITIAETQIPIGRPEASYKAGVRFVSGDRAEEGIFVNLSVAENLVATRLNNKSKIGFINPSDQTRKAKILAQSVGVNVDRLKSIANELSGGNQQKLAFGRYVNDANAKVIVMIEPTRGIDVGARAEIYKLMREFCDLGYGILISSTDFAEVLGLGDIIITMYRGQIVKTYNSDTVTMQGIIADVTHPEV